MVAAAPVNHPALYYVPVVVVAVAGATLPPETVVADVTIRSGRSRFDDGLEPATCTLQIMTADAATDLVIGDALTITVDGAPRFTGRIAEVTRAATSGTQATTFTVVGAGGIARMGRILVELPLPAGSAKTRCETVLTAAGYVPDTYGGEEYGLAAYGEVGDAPQSLAAVLGAIMTDTGVVIADNPDGTIMCQFPDSRLSQDRFTPAPEATHVDLEWVQTDDLINACTVVWDADPPALATNDSSIARFDRHELQVTTTLADSGSATRRASSVVARLALPVYECGDVETWDPAVLAHTIGALVTLAPLPSSAPVPGGTWTGVLEGWQDHYSPATDGSGALAATWDLAISDPRKSSEVLVWLGVDPDTLQWSQVYPTTAWDEAISNGDLSAMGG